jgi:hypothetical protein
MQFTVRILDLSVSHSYLLRLPLKADLVTDVRIRSRQIRWGARERRHNCGLLQRKRGLVCQDKLRFGPFFWEF